MPLLIGTKIGIMRDMWNSPSHMEPMLPSPSGERVSALALDVVSRSAALGGLVRTPLRRSLVELLRRMNSYYSNLIEGHHTHPVDIERALARDYSDQPAKRRLQLESRAHVLCQERIEERLASEPAVEICSADFLRWIHHEFYREMPDEYRWVSGVDAGTREPVVPGELRRREVQVAEHVAPAASSIPAMLARFEEAYRPSRHRGLDLLVAAAAAHHRLAWIHPFLDGNGRVARLFTHAYLIRCNVDGHRLWTVTRGFGRRREEYYAALAGADVKRHGDLDGRGNLSNEGLRRFCTFFLETAVDQIDFMAGLLELDGLEARVLRYAQAKVTIGELPNASGLLLRDVLLRGEVPRGEAPRITGLGERRARDVVSALVGRRLLVSDTPKGPVRLGLPAEITPYYFPRLYPEGVEATVLSAGGR